MPRRYGGIALFDIPGVGITVDVKLLVIYIGGILGIVAMRFVAGYFLVMLERFQGLAKGAYYLVGWIGLKLLGGGLHDAVHPTFAVGPGNWRESLPEWVGRMPLEIHGVLFWSVMALIILISLAYKPRRSKDVAGPDAELVATAKQANPAD